MGSVVTPEIKIWCRILGHTYGPLKVIKNQSGKLFEVDEPFSYCHRCFTPKEENNG